MRTRWLSSLTHARPSWICITLTQGAVTPEADGALRELGCTPLADNAACYAMQAQDNWSMRWQEIHAVLLRLGLERAAESAIMAGEDRPDFEEVALHHKTVEETQRISEQMWLIDVIGNNGLHCYFQPVIDRRGEVFGYEALVRAVDAQGGLISGGAIFKASHVLRIEHLIDRHLHELAIQSYTERKLTGFLFINLVPGFIQRPEFYFGSLAEAARQHGMNAKNIVLDCTNSENPRDMQHLKAITQYCLSQGYLLSLDDIESPQAVRRILKEMQPDFIKLDMRLVQRAAQPEAMTAIREIVDMTRNSSCSLIAEGVETEATRKLLEQEDIHLYQGYLFSPPEEFSSPAGVPPAQSKSTASAAKRESRA